MKRTVSTIFDTHTRANRAISSLISEGFRREDISLVVSEKTRVAHYPEDATAEAMGWGAGVGAIAGSLIGIAAAPPFGLFVAGPLMGLLGGVAVGATGGGLVGALVEAGLSAEQAKLYEKRLGEGAVFVSVHVDDAAAAKEAARLLERASDGETRSSTRITPQMHA